MQSLRKLTGFMPYLLVVFLNAFVDLGHKVTIQNTILKVWDDRSQVIFTAIINGLILLPFILLFTPAGFLSDRFAKHKVIRWGAASVVVATVLITLAYYQGWFWLAFALTLMLSIQSAIYSPAKLGLIREMVHDDQLAGANGVVQATSIAAILAGTLVFSGLFEMFYEPRANTASSTLQMVYPLGFALVGLSALELLLSFRLPTVSKDDTSKVFDRRAYVRGQYLANNLSAIRSHKPIWLSIVGLSVFMALSQVMLAAFPAHAKVVLQDSNALLIQGLLATTGIGIVLGSLLAGRLSKAHLELGWIPLSAAGITAGLAVLPLLANPWAIGVLFCFIGLCGGLFIVPLNALIQYTAKEDQLGTVLAGNNWVQNLFMLSFLGLTVAFAWFGFRSTQLFYFLTAVAAVGFCYTVVQLPHSLARLVAGAILKHRYQVSVSGFDHLPRRGGVLLLGNHISWIDWALVQVACPRAVRFVMIRDIYQVWYLKPILKFFGAIPISPGNSKASLAQVAELLRQGEVVCIFPEGTISRNGQLAQFKRGFERACETLAEQDAVIVPFYLRGLWGSKLSRSRSEKLRANTSTEAKRNIIVAFGQPLAIHTTAEQLKQKVFELSIDAWENYTTTLDPVPLAWLKQAKSRPLAKSVYESNGGAYSNVKMVAASTLLAGKVRQFTQQSNVGVLLPTSAPGIIANLAVMLSGKCAVNLNYTTGNTVIESALNNAAIDCILTSKLFLQKLKAKGIDVQPNLMSANLVYLEDVMKAPSKARWLWQFTCALALPAKALVRVFGRPMGIDQPAQILFSSGSEGTPKGIVLSHRNLMGNIKQISDVLNTQGQDKMVACLPLFHSFGLTVNSLLPMVEGIAAICHPDPTDVFATAKAIAKYQGTILCGTASFLRLYTRNKKVEPLMLDSLRVVVAGAEKLTPEVRQGFELKFKKVIYEGYGATETTPVASVNIPDGIDPRSWRVQEGNKIGSVGLPLPGTCFRIVDPETRQPLPAGEAGMILIAGGQVMQGYLNNPEKTNQVIIEQDGRCWYVTGDKGVLDGDGFLTIIDRYSRFAKIGGEMVSLARVEEAVKTVMPGNEPECVAVNIADDKKGEKIIALVAGVAEVDSFKQQLIDVGVNPLVIPARFYCVESIPKLGSGKLNLAAAKLMAREFTDS
ncbi:acyl-[ACP]--phospholipid O-acyltransferase [Halioxenophilus aromaticivorans]|uniref:Acyl-[ACP]--phospholipid O-acyltransferase n=1 Tax=Halioxenophilus aromaticivorans TaxID=1306992 RepID=A0AAV3TYT5_9ALTE